jgi:DAK2 domain fusion protein YloV
VERKAYLDGHDLKAMFAAGSDWLEKIVPDINALNVYPVPDGDCGTNMLMTIRASLEEAGRLADGGAGDIVQAIYKGALMGARGNSGVILSQIWHGLAQELQDKAMVDTGDLARALRKAAETAYLALSHPVEGTILTVAREAAAAAEREASNADATPASVMAAAVKAARAAVMNTPNLLDVLKEAGVVDAGGHGLYTFLEGALLYLKGETDSRSPEVLSHQAPLVIEAPPVPHEKGPFGFCTQFMVRGTGLSVAGLREALAGLGESLIVVGDAAAIRVHIHTHDTIAVTRTAASFGTVFDLDIRNMDDQHQDFLLMRRERAAVLPAAVIAVVSGDGLIDVFAGLGVAAVVPGGQTMNPSTTDIVHAVEKVPSENVIILPNNKNIIPTAELARQLTTKILRVIPTETVPQGISALVAFLPEAGIEANVAAMTDAAATVRTIEVTRATRSTRLNDLEVREGQFIGLLDGKLITAGDAPEDAVLQVLAGLDLNKDYVMTVYFGADASEKEARQIGTLVRGRYPRLEIGVIQGGQPSYPFIISIE